MIFAHFGCFWGSILTPEMVQNTILQFPVVAKEYTPVANLVAQN